MMSNDNLNLWKQRHHEINMLLPEAKEFLVKSGMNDDSESSPLVVSALWVDANEKDRLIFTALNDLQKLCKSSIKFNEVDTVRGVEPVIAEDELLNSFYCLWTLGWGGNKGISVKLSTNSSVYRPVMSIKCRLRQAEIPVTPTDDERQFLKCLGDCFLFERNEIP